MLDTSTLPSLVDELTELNVQIASLTARADKIKSDLISTGLPEICGSLTRAVVSNIPAGVTYDYKAAIAYYAPDADLSAFAKKKAGYSRLEIKGYNARKAA